MSHPGDETGTNDVDQSETERSERAIADGSLNGVSPGGQTPGQTAASYDNTQQRAIQAAGWAGVVAVVGWMLWRLRLRRRPPTPTERLTEASQALSTASVEYGGRALERAGSAAKAAEPVVRRTGELALQGLQATAEGAGELASRAAGVGGKAASAGKSVGGGLAAVPGVVTDAGESVHGWWRKWTLRLLVTLSAGTGYVLGARAGRERYDQIAGAASTLAQRPEVKHARDRVRDEAQSRLGQP